MADGSIRRYPRFVRQARLGLATVATLALAGCAVPGPLQGPLMATHLIPFHCVAQAQPAGAPAVPAKATCFTTQAEALVGLLFIGNQQQVTQEVHSLLPRAQPLAFIGAGKPMCAAMLVDAHTMGMKAACFSTLQLRDSATAAWH
jgi:hypothetical protein